MPLSVFLSQYLAAMGLLALALPVTVLSADEAGSRAALPGGINTEGLKPDCFYARDVANWEALNRTNLVVYAPNKSRAYLVSISPPSVELRSAVDIAFDGRDRICGTAGERLIVGRGRGEIYSIMAVWRLDKESLERILESGQKSRDKKKPGAVEPAAESPGAAIETDIQPERGADDSNDSGQKDAPAGAARDSAADSGTDVAVD